MFNCNYFSFYVYHTTRINVDLDLLFSHSVPESAFCIIFVISLGFITLNNFAKLCHFTAHSLFQIADEYVPVGLHGDFLPARKLTINSCSPYCKLFLYGVAVQSGKLLYVVVPCKKLFHLTYKYF